MLVQISDLYAVAYTSILNDKIAIYPKLFDNKEKAQELADEVKGVVNPVYFSGEIIKQ